jgi:hypothetical protein
MLFIFRLFEEDKYLYMKVLVVFLVLIFNLINVYGQTNSSLSTDLMRVKQIYEEVDSLKSISIQNKLYIDSLDGVYFQKIQTNCPDFVGQKTIIDKAEIRQWAVQYQIQFIDYKAILEEFITIVETTI